MRLCVTALLLLSCAHNAPLKFETSSTPPEEKERRAPGIALDRSTRLPEATLSAPAEQTVLVLRPPLSRDEALAVVGQYFDAIFREDLGKLSRLLVPHANLVGASSRSTSQVRDNWARRFRLFDYGAARAQLIYNEAHVASYTQEELASIRPRRVVHLPIRPEELLCVIPIVEAGGAPRRRFGSVIELSLTPTPDGFKVRSVYEDFRLP